jgi:hypothetical protein
VPQGRDTVGERPIMRIRHPRGSLGPLARQLEFPRKYVCKRSIRVERPTQGIIGAQLDRSLEVGDRLADAPLVG